MVRTRIDANTLRETIDIDKAGIEQAKQDLLDKKRDLKSAIDDRFAEELAYFNSILAEYEA